MPNRALIRFISVVHRELYRASRGLVGGHTGGPVLLLTTLGRKSGRSRTTPLLYVQESTNWIVVGSNGGDDRHPAWWLNLKADANATIQVKGKVERVRAREATEEERVALWPPVRGDVFILRDLQEPDIKANPGGDPPATVTCRHRTILALRQPRFDRRL